MKRMNSDHENYCKKPVKKKKESGVLNIKNDHDCYCKKNKIEVESEAVGGEKLPEKLSVQQSMKCGRNYEVKSEAVGGEEWPEKLSFEHSMKCVRNYEEDTNFKNMYRQICCVCGQVNISNKSLKQYNVEFLKKHKHLLHKDNIEYLKKKKMPDFQYAGPYEELNDCIIKKGY